MAAADQLQNLKDEATCSICLEYFKEPVSMDCGHNFCVSCITDCWDQVDESLPCPQCRGKCQHRNLRPNKPLANMVEILQKLHIPDAKPQVEPLCPEHEEKLKMFCAEDQKAICVVCSMSMDHKPHSVVPIEEAFQEYKKKLHNQLQAMKQELQEILKCQSNEKKKAKELETETENQRQRIIFEFEELHQFLKEQQHILLTRLDEDEHEILLKIRKSVNLLEDQKDYLKNVIPEVEERFQQPAHVLLKDVKDMLSRCENMKFQRPLPVSPVLKTSFQLNFPRQFFVLEKMSSSFTGRLSAKLGTISSELEWRRARNFAVTVTLDPETANSELTLSENRKSVQYGATKEDLPDSPKRFMNNNVVLACEGFTSGKHYWEVEVGDKNDWTLGICKDSVQRINIPKISPECGFWRVGLARGNEYWAGTSPVSILRPRVNLKTVGVFLDYDAGKVSFYNVEEKSHLFTFTHNFTQVMRPYFSLCRSAGAIKLHPVTEWE